MSVLIIILVIQASVSSLGNLLVNKGVRTTSQQLEARIYNAIRLAEHSSSAIAICGGTDLACDSSNWSDGYITMTSIFEPDGTFGAQVLFKSDKLKRLVKIKTDLKRLVILPGGYLELANPAVFVVCSEGLSSDSIRLNLEPSGLVTQTFFNGPLTCSETPE